MLGKRLSAPMLWAHGAFLQMSLDAALPPSGIQHGLWFAPFYGCYCCLIWSRRAAFLWASYRRSPISVVEKIAFNTTHFTAFIWEHLRSGPGADAFTAQGGVLIASLTPLILGQFLDQPRSVDRLAVTAAFLAVAVRLRRHRGPVLIQSLRV